MDIRSAFTDATGAHARDWRAVPVWGLNDELAPAELRRQMRQMHRAGLAGPLIHARTGLLTPYLSDSWMQCIRQVIDEAGSLAVRVWLHDDEGWPSGSGGGAVPASGLDSQQKTLQMELLSPKRFTPKSNTVAMFLGVRRRMGFAGLRRVEPRQVSRVASVRETLLHFYYVASPGYSDLLSATAVQQFIASAHERCRSRLGREFGRTVSTIFTDEPQYALVPWSFDLAEHFGKLFGEDLLDCLPSLFVRHGDFRKVRWQFFRAVSDLFVESYGRQVSQWCSRHRVALAGHLAGEETLSAQVAHAGSAMAHYEHLDIPGIRHRGAEPPGPVQCKQASSAARQMGRQRVLSEMFVAAGWGVSPEQLKWLAECQFALGINLPCVHLCHYSLRGGRKRDLPPGLGHQQPWWRDLQLLNDLFARELAVLTAGRGAVEILVLHPIESAWALFDVQNTAEVERLDGEFALLSRLLLEIQRDYDYGEEGMLARRARVCGRTLRVGQGAYSVVVVPPLAAIRASTLRVLERFMKKGGKVLCTGRLPLRVDGEPSKGALRTLGKALRTRLTRDALRKALHACLPSALQARPLFGSSVEALRVHQRDCGPLQAFFLVNSSQQRQVRATLRIRGHGTLERWEADSGQCRRVPSRLFGQHTVATLALPPTGSTILVLDRRRRKATTAARPAAELRRILLPQRWTVRRLDPNALPLDRCHYRTNGGDWTGPTALADLREQLLRLDGTARVEMRFVVASDLGERPGRHIGLALESPAEYTIRLNGQPVPAAEAGWFVDNCIHVIPLPNWLVRGENEVVLSREFAGNPCLAEQLKDPAVHVAEKRRMCPRQELEVPYIVGDFAVRCGEPLRRADENRMTATGPFVLIEEALASSATDLLSDGLVFYAGRVELRQKIELTHEMFQNASAIRLELEPPSAAVIAVYVNGREMGRRAWRPYAFDMTPALVEGTNEIGIVLTSTLGNLFSHEDAAAVQETSTSAVRASPAAIRAADAVPTSVWHYRLLPFGLAGHVWLVVTG